jgi:hypothetical protein
MDWNSHLFWFDIVLLLISLSLFRGAITGNFYSSGKGSLQPLLCTCKFRSAASGNRHHLNWSLRVGHSGPTAAQQAADYPLVSKSVPDYSWAFPSSPLRQAQFRCQLLVNGAGSNSRCNTIWYKSCFQRWCL